MGGQCEDRMAGGVVERMGCREGLLSGIHGLSKEE